MGCSCSSSTPSGDDVLLTNTAATVQGFSECEKLCPESYGYNMRIKIKKILKAIEKSPKLSEAQTRYTQYSMAAYLFILKGNWPSVLL